MGIIFKTHLRYCCTYFYINFQKTSQFKTANIYHHSFCGPWMWRATLGNSGSGLSMIRLQSCCLCSQWSPLAKPTPKVRAGFNSSQVGLWAQLLTGFSSSMALSPSIFFLFVWFCWNSMTKSNCWQIWVYPWLFINLNSSIHRELCCLNWGTGLYRVPTNLID